MSRASGERGDLAIVLHSHMPYVEGFGNWPFGEEWLLEAIAACYVPLVELLERWAEDGTGVATVGITPVLADQLALPGVGDSFLAFMRDVRRECHRQDIEGLEQSGQQGAADALRLTGQDYERAAEQFERRGQDLLGAFTALQRAGAVELWASSATHAVLPMLETEAGVRLQVDAGIDSHRERFGGWGGGFWLPECAYRPGVDAALTGAGVRAFCVDQTAHGDPLDQLEPTTTESGAIAIPIDWQTISLVWNEAGYPADAIYRDYHAQTINGMRPWCNGGEPYLRDAAHAKAREHAREFVAAVGARLDDYRAARGRRGLSVCALDTELLGHWWYEGPVWLDAVAREARAAGVDLVTLPQALERHDPVARPLHESSWGADKDLSTWDAPAVEDLRWPAARAELELTAALGAGRIGDGRAALRAARELLALQSSDWAFMETRALAGDYPRRRVEAHTAAFVQALAAFRRGLQDFPAMPGGNQTDQAAGGAQAGVDPALRGLAPLLELSPLTEPASPWGRQWLADPEGSLA